MWRKIYYNSRDIEFSPGDYFLAHPVYSVLFIYSSDRRQAQRDTEVDRWWKWGQKVWLPGNGFLPCFHCYSATPAYSLSLLIQVSVTIGMLIPVLSPLLLLIIISSTAAASRSFNYIASPFFASCFSSIICTRWASRREAVLPRPGIPGTVPPGTVLPGPGRRVRITTSCPSRRRRYTAVRGSWKTKSHHLLGI